METRGSRSRRSNWSCRKENKCFKTSYVLKRTGSFDAKELESLHSEFFLF